MQPIVWFFLAFLILMVIRTPLYLCLLGSSLVYFTLNTNLSMITVMSKMMDAPNSFTLLAVPFFILAAQVMNNGGVTDKIFGFCLKLVGHVRGGLAYVNILASLIFSGISGSALADVGGLGVIEMKAMRDEKYDDDITIGVTGASATVGPIIPPSIPFVIYASMAGVSVGALFLAGVGPGLLICLVLSIYVYFIVKKRNYPRHERATFKEIIRSFWGALPALLFPVILLGGIWGGFFTPTEAALVSVIYGLLVSSLIYKQLKLKEIPKLLWTSVKQVGPSIAVVVTASIFAWILTYEKVDQIVVRFILSITTNRILILLIMNVILLILGMFIEVVAAIMITLPIFAPLMAIAGINPIHMGVILTLNMMIGLLTPPVGFSLYMLSTVSGLPFNTVVKMVSKWWIPLFITLLLVTYVEPITMWLPRLLGLA
ncbi:MAG: Sialic acid TRAP transporter permease protein SiaT [Spirochaetes bacterium ADurb.Bin110]|nr:MAG: Sialic acid TRAP transporter permease protein SiaT [Spirochaetes bacterium ADurb.Bin110]